MLLVRSVGSMGIALPAFLGSRELATDQAGQGGGAKGAERAKQAVASWQVNWGEG
jgi:hypothetical protein